MKPDGRYPKTLSTLGDHVRKRRLDLGLLQREAGSRLGADPKTVNNWETGKCEPRLRFIPRILAFLGYDPRPAGASLGDRLRLARTAQGLSIHSLAGLLGVDENTVWKWEEGRHLPTKQLRDRLEATFPKSGTDCPGGHLLLWEQLVAGSIPAARVRQQQRMEERRQSHGR